MTDDAPNVCSVCGRSGHTEITEVNGGVVNSRSFCSEHIPTKILDDIPAYFFRTPDENVAMLRKLVVDIDHLYSDHPQRTQFVARIEKLIAGIEGCNRSVGDAG